MSGVVLFEHRHRGHLWRLEVATFKGRSFGNWRKWYSDTDGWRATREGCTIPLEGLGALTASLMAYHGLEPPQSLEIDS